MPKRILFFGDSITDCSRPRDQFYGFGKGYSYLVKAYLGANFPNEYEFINRGIGGDRSIDLFARIKIDFINLKPDYASLFFGVNDTLHEIQSQNGLSTEKFEKIYTMMLDEIIEACPNTKLMILTPFVLKGWVTEEEEGLLERYQQGVAEKAAVVKKIAEKYGIPYADTQAMFNEALKKADDTYWSDEGIHPTDYGHELLKNLWLETFEKIK
ncbi:MAG: lysophospholipase [Ruminococcaceae bacterium]|nr:lysophospholipase [Oscillospiraceae bacterium]